MVGFSDEDLAKHTEFFKPHVIPNPKSYFMYDSSHEPDDWFEPVQIWEVLCADLSLSPVHKAAIGMVSFFVEFLDSKKIVKIYFVDTGGS